MFCVFAERLHVMYTYYSKRGPQKFIFHFKRKERRRHQIQLFLQNFPVFLTAYNLKYNKSVFFFNVPSFFEVS